MSNLGRITVMGEDGLISEELANYLERQTKIPEYTSAQLTDINSQANRDKYLGKPVTDVTLSRPLWGGGNDLNSPWVDSAGNPVHTVA